MKRSKKLLALVLALMLSFSCMAMPAMAHSHDDGGIMPVYEVGTCPWCGGVARYQSPDKYGRVWVMCLEGDLCGRCGWL